MQKLIELLNEYENTDNWENRYQVEFRESKIISKKFGFIKWLVENDKIDSKKVRDTAREISEACFRLHQRRLYECTLMLLSISEQPIELLISILK